MSFTPLSNSLSSTTNRVLTNHTSPTNKLFRVWHQGLIHISDPHALTVLRDAMNAVQDTSGTAAVAATGADGDQYLTLDINWMDQRGHDIASLVCLRHRSGDDQVRWLIAAATRRPWNQALEAPARKLRLDDVQGRDVSELPLTDIPFMTSLRRRTRDNVAPLLASMITHPERSSAVLVVSNPDVDLPGGWPGLVTIFRIDEDVRIALNKHLPPMISVPQASARLFFAACDDLPDAVAPAKTDAMRLQVLLPQFVQQAINARQATPLPADWIALDPVRAWWMKDPFTPCATPRPDTQPAVEATPSDPQPSTNELDSLREAVVTLQTQNATAEQQSIALAADNAEMRAQLDKRDEEYTAIAEDNRLLADELERLTAELENVDAERDKLRRALGLISVHRPDQDLPEDAAIPLTDIEFGSCAELLDAARIHLPQLAITAANEPAAALDHHPKAALWRRKAWDALCSLNAYAEARLAALDTNEPLPPELATFYAFSKAGQPGSLISANTVSGRESDQVTNTERYRQERMFPVDPATDPRGVAYFGAHISIERSRPPAPRIYFLDDLSRTRRVYIGYIGSHLSTSRTN